MDLIIIILPVVTKDLPISPGFFLRSFYRDASSTLLQPVNQWLSILSSNLLSTLERMCRPKDAFEADTYIFVSGSKY